MISKVFLAGIITFISSFNGGSFVVNDIQKVNDEANNYSQEKKLPHKNTNSLGVDISAKAGLVVDIESDQVLFEKNKDLVLPMASLTKIMTAVVLLDSDISMEESYTVEQKVMNYYGSDIDLEVGEEVNMKDLLHGLLINSGNDAAMAIAHKVSDSKEGFVAMMNKKAEELGMNSTNFNNPHGLDQKDHYSTASDLAILARYAYQNPVYQQVIRMKEYQFDAINIPKHHQFKNTNQLVHEEYFLINGGKTGFTDNAGYCLITYGINEDKQEIITVLLGESNDGMQFHDTKAMIEWAFGNYYWN